MKQKFSFYSLIPELKKESGHHYQYHQQVQQVVHSLEGQFVAYVNDKCSVEGIQKEWKKWFRRKKDPGFVIRYLYRIFIDFSRIFIHEKNEKGQPRIFFLESFTLGDLVPFVLASLFFSKAQDRVWILFRFERGKKEMAVQSFLMKFAKFCLKHKWSVLCDSELLLPRVEETFKQKIEFLPHYLSQMVIKEVPKSCDKIVCSWLGSPRVEKGLKWIANLTTINDGAAEKFALSVSQKTNLAPPQNQLTILHSSENLIRENYEKEFLKSDVILLPYDPAAYRYRTSGIFIEAILGGKVPIVTEGTWAAFQLRQFGLDELIVKWDNPLFFTHLHQLLQMKEIKLKLSRMKEIYEENHSFPSLKMKFNSLLALQPGSQGT